MRKIVGSNVPAQVMHRHQRLARRIGKALGKVYAHQYSADQAGRKGDGNGIELLHRNAGVGQGLFHGGADIFGVAAAGDLGHHAPV